ncbi:MAG TPA: DNA adenine methylase, partial [Paenirhodobacter sp.]
PMLEDLHSRLSGLVIECLDWSAFIPRYDDPGTLFYLDPPYWGCEDDYGKQMFARDDFTRLADMLGKIQGRFVLSLNDVPEIRTVFSGFQIAEVRTCYTVNARREGTQNAELLISNVAL